MKVADILEAFPKVSGEDAKRIISTLNAVDKPEDVDGALEEVSEILGGFGVEAIQPEGAWVDSYWREAILYYVNMGDTYRRRSPTTRTEGSSSSRVGGTYWKIRSASRPRTRSASSPISTA